MDVYVTKLQLINFFSEDELIQRTDRPPFTGMINDVVLAESVTAAEKLIDGYLRSVYPLPLSPDMIAGSSLPEKCADITRFYLYDDMATDLVIMRYKEALNWLREVQTKRVTLGIVDETATPTGSVVIKQGVSGFDWDKY
jgi:phage gp36-like protein